jgi:O-antigen/teichoic acid export membrane protein
MQGYMFWSFFILLGYSCLMMGDVVLVKHLYPAEASDFSYAATLGRLVIFLPQALVVAMFPKVVAEDEGSRVQRGIYLKTLLMTLLVTTFAALCFFFLAEYALRWIFGIATPSANLLGWSRSLAWIMVPVSLLSVTIPFALAQRKLWAVSFMPVSAACYIGYPLLFGGGVNSILLCLAIVSVISLVLCGFTLFGRGAEASAGWARF